MSAVAGWEFDVEVYPEGWNFPAGPTWVAGWIQPPAGQGITDIRARLHHRIILGLSGLPHPTIPVSPPGRPASTRSGFSFLLDPHAGAFLLQLEARNAAGQWVEFFRKKISAAPGAARPPLLPRLSQSLGRLVTALLRRRLRQPRETWLTHADDLMATFVAEPLQVDPSQPFVGALEEPHDIGRLHYGLIPVTGWLVHGRARITRLTAVIDSLPPIDLPHGRPRADVTTVFPALPEQGRTAFVGEIALPADLAAPVLLKIFAELDNGERHLAFARRFTLHYHHGSGEMPPLVSAGTIVRATWALFRSAGPLKLPRRGLIRAAWAIWRNYRAIPAYHPRKYFPLLGQLAARSRQGLRRQEATTLTAPVCPVIAPADDMCRTDTAQYFQLGREALILVEQAHVLAGGGRIDAILDLPGGFGRVARWLRVAYPAARLTVSDIQEPAVAFCVEHLGVTGVPAKIDGSHWATLPGPYDVIWCGSLLTHLNRAGWVEHLRRFAERLTPHGILVFTSHGRLVLDKLQCGENDYGLPPAEITRLCTDTVTDGFGYVDYPATPAYGISAAQPAWVFELVAHETKLCVLDYREAAWDQHQDVVVCSLAPRAGAEG
ncbi:MAG: class I SAM-dependent methyltransferase [Lacunisphaera sp.]|nr:class I SAM-dependent methyltransferase [Lacunisphaera sp.]